ncbi:MAG: tRNA (adenosine(37)-N6)-dimethylallyltransferase MiaA [Paludibacteraceae bacterium]|nr:tRNA (adenosine(37)-N6)-dimethylallyltransferase MiaA [Paludibacteraceae bacterium]
MKRLLVITGPTGVGKTDLTLRLAERYDCPILNADSRQIYKDIPIGTAAPTQEDQARVKHFFVETKNINETYNAGEFERDCLDVIRRLPDTDVHHPVTAVLSGGSMLYIDAVCNGLDDIPPVPESIRQTVQQLYRQGGIARLQSEVQRLDPVYWERVDQANPQRLMHCIEVSMVAGCPYSSFRKKKTIERPFEVVKVVLDRPREELYTRINQRVLVMIKEGLEDEARKVWKEPIPNSLNTVGYKEMFAFFRNEISRDEAVRLIQQNSRHYAKRQITWFRQYTDAHWLSADLDYEEQIHILDSWLTEPNRM